MVRFPAPLRTVREEPEFGTDLRTIFRDVVPNPQLLDELLNGVVFALARDPHIGARIMSTNIWAIPVDLPRPWPPTEVAVGGLRAAKSTFVDWFLGGA